MEESPLVFMDFGNDRWKVPEIVGDFKFDAVLLRKAIDCILKSGISDLPKSPLTLYAARRFERLAEELCISTPAEIRAMHQYFTLKAIRDVMLDLIQRDIPLPFWIDTGSIVKNYPRK